MRASLLAVTLSILAGGAAMAAPGPAEDADPKMPLLHERPYVYQPRGDGEAGTGTVSYELGYGTRATRFFGDEGVEQALGARYQVLDGLAVEGRGGLLLAPDADPRFAGAADLLGRLLDQARHGVDLDLGAGYLYDYRARHVLHLRAGVSRAFGRLDLQGGADVEVPLSGEGDGADLAVSVAASYRVAPWYRQGLELGAEDLEGFWEAEEAEGGAKLVFGPTAYVTLGRQIELRLNTSAVYAHPLPGPAATASPTWGFLGRAVVAFAFE